MKIINGQIKRIEKDGFVYCNVPVQYAIEQNLISQADIDDYLKNKKISNDLQALNQQRDKELRGFTIDNIEMNEDILYKMAVKFNTTADDEKIRWIDADNNIVEFTIQEFGTLIKKGTQKVEQIYFKYRQLKDKALQEAN